MLFCKTMFEPETKTLTVFAAPDVIENRVSFVVCELKFTAVLALIKNIAEQFCVEPTIKIPLVVLFAVITFTDCPLTNGEPAVPPVKEIAGEVIDAILFELVSFKLPLESIRIRSVPAEYKSKLLTPALILNVVASP
jgi:hypothetical protein